MEENKSKVYILIDSENRIIRCEGGYTMSNIANINEWIFVDEGFGDKYNLCQSHYFDGGLYTDDGICRYVWEGDFYRLRTDEEIDADRTKLVEPEQKPDTLQEEINAIKNDLAAEKVKTAALEEELAAAKILLGVE